MEKKNIVLISGKQGSGKTTLAASLQRYLWPAKIIKFAGPIYQLHDALLPILHRWGVRPESMRKDGELLQVLGTEYGRNKLGANVWADIVRRQADEALTTTLMLGERQLPNRKDRWVIIDDARFENEFDAFPDAWRVRLEAREDVRKARCSYWREETSHPSEVGLDNYAAANMFDINARTDTGTCEHTAKFILAEIGFLP